MPAASTRRDDERAVARLRPLRARTTSSAAPTSSSARRGNQRRARQRRDSRGGTTASATAKSSKAVAIADRRRDGASAAAISRRRRRRAWRLFGMCHGVRRCESADRPACDDPRSIERRIYCSGSRNARGVERRRTQSPRRRRPPTLVDAQVQRKRAGAVDRPRIRCIIAPLCRCFLRRSSSQRDPAGRPVL